MSATPWPVEANPLGTAVPNAIAEALAERMHACNGQFTHDQMKYMRIPTSSSNFSFAFCQTVQRALLSMIPKFINMDYDYAADNAWETFPKMLTLHDVCSVEERNIMLMPPQYGSALNFAAWFVKACNVLDMLHTTMPASPPVSHWLAEGSDGWESFPGAVTEEDIAAQIEWARDNPSSSRASVTVGSFRRTWAPEVWRNGPDGEWHGVPDLVVDVSADYKQQSDFKYTHGQQLTAIPQVVAFRSSFYGGPTNPPSYQTYFDGMGSGYVLGLNPLDPVAPGSVTQLDSVDKILLPEIPVFIETRPYVEPFDSTIPWIASFGYELVLCLDWRTEGGFKYYTVPE